MVVHHRLMQRHGFVSTPIRERQCENCKQPFKSKMGLRNHQSRSKNPACFRAGFKSLRTDWLTKRKVYHYSWKKRQVFDNHKSVFEAHNQGKAFTAGEKQICLNVYQHLRGDGMDLDKAVSNAALMTGIPKDSIQLFLKEKLSGQLMDNTAKFKNSMTQFERLSLEELDLIRHMIHQDFSNFIRKKGELAKDMTGEYPTIESIHIKIQDSGNFDKWSKSTTRTIILSMGFKFLRAHAVNHAALIESDYIIQHRRKYIIKITEAKRAKRSIAYFDESYVNR